MYLKEKKTGDLVEITDTQDLFNPFHPTVPGRIHAGEELQEQQEFNKADLVFPSDEALPRCWVDGNYKAQA